MKEAFENTEVKPREKLKVTKADIVVSCTPDKPYFNIHYREVGNDDDNIGFGSYDLNNVFKWREEELEIVSEVEAEYINKSTEHINKSSDCSTNADRIRAMSDEELADFLEQFEACDVCKYYDKNRCTFENPCVHEFAGVMIYEWLKSPIE